ncbi:bifunctional folylpolyglutamate synthase/dihydrofolate synthase [Sulfurovum sp. bin170]|uniref:bifunctional folylpolyglutamate synthase/dihydrofolate synthase n=1 Tax=Sulfurovum sp. bin170 TaxID=2695268 RepID=UPI0013E0841F|nr:bifunctional folylpolyglutamate synthase/dihydrofolate synthase [Sulfurovum sp. bin170]NEW61567.1 bifunctional folylpolyglutamate synthase/dihydrofolate synthase [Sulfurovum sp. bin170]
MKNQKPSFANFITEKPLYYKEIDHKRVYRAYALLEPCIKKPLVVHIVGTNGKGSTGRIMATLLHCADYRVGHFSSPHILKFNERIWIEGEDIADEGLEIAHAKLYAILGQDICDGLSYFEYTTLLALVAMEDLDVVVLEAGLGGEFDATNVVSKELSVITPIGLDHQDFLGDTIASIATTKLNSIEKRAVLGFQPNQEVYEIADEIAKSKETKLYKVKESDEEILALTRDLGWSYYLYENSLLAISGLEILNLSYSIENLKSVKLFGRFHYIAPNIIIDVGHNLMAADVIAKALEQRFCDKRVVLVYNSLDDKDYSAILKRLKKHIKRVEIISIETDRVVDVTILQDELKKLSIEYKEFKTINKYENYLIFGSFFVVEAFIEKDLL